MIKTAECVTPMHPDKICDRISDAVLDACLEQDPKSRVAIETMGGHGVITVTGELSTKAYVNIPEIVKRVTKNKYGVQTNIVSQSPAIARGVDIGGAGDQGIMVGYACNENKAMIPQELYLARDLCQFLYKKFPYDGKTQVTLRNNMVETVVASFQNVPKQTLKKQISKWLESKKLIAKTIYANPAGDWLQGGFEADTGVTGRKLAVDNYGPQIPIGGGCFSGKDPSKVDRSGAYMARRMATDYLIKHKAKEVIVKLAYAIGVVEPVMVSVNIDGKETKYDNSYNLTPKGIINLLKLQRPQYEEVAEWGSFGHGFEWE